MHFGETIGLLLAVTLAAFVLRAYWRRMPRWMEKTLFIAGSIAIGIRFVFLITLWGTTSSRGNSIICWFSVIAYELILVRFSLMRPRWVTSFCAVILLLPLFGSSLLFPLTGIFATTAPERREIAKDYELEREPWDATLSGRPGYDFRVLYRPSWIPFLQHMVQRASFSNEQCLTEQVTASIDAQNHLVHFHCPARHEQQSDIDLILPLKQRRTR